MVRTKQVLDSDDAIEVDQIVKTAPDAHAAITAWLNVFARLLHMPDSQRSAIRNELYEHLRERTRDLMLANRTETESVRIAIEELGETVQLARRFEAANRPHTRRWLMYASMLGFGAAVLVTGAVVLTPDQQPQSIAAVFQQDEAQLSEAALRLAEKEVEVPPDLSLVETLRAALSDTGLELQMSEREFQNHGIDINDHLQLELRRAPVPLVLDQIVREISRDASQFAWRVDDRVVEIAAKEVLDARDVVLVSYNIADVIRSITTYGRPYENAVADVTSLLHELVEPESWRENGGALAQLRVVGARMFVQAPKRMHTQIEWILEQLRQDIEKPAAQAQPAAPAIDGAEATRWKVARAALELEKAQEALSLIKQRYDSGATSKSELVEAEYAVKIAELELAAASASPSALQSRTRLQPGDKIIVSVFELYQPNEWTKVERTVDGDGLIKVPEVGELNVVGMKRRELEDTIVREIKDVIMNPKVDVEVEFTGAVRSANLVR